MFIFEKAPFPSCHASTLVEHEPGKLLAAWFGGKDEGAKDVQIWSSVFDGKKWGELAVIGTEPGQPCWNPVLFKTAKGTLYLWYKAGPKPEQLDRLRPHLDRQRQDVVEARDDARDVLRPGAGEADPTGERHDPRGHVGESYRNWTPFVDRSTDDGKTWTRSNAFNVPEKFGQIQPTLFEAKDGKIVALMRSKDPQKVCRAESKDGGVTFTPAEETELPNPSAGIDVVKTKDGDVFLIYNPTAVAPHADQSRALDRRRQDVEEGGRSGNRAGRVLVPGDDRVGRRNVGDHLHVEAHAHQAPECRP